MSQSFSLSKKMKELEELERYFQSAEIDLHEAIKKQKQAVEIANEILAFLETAENSLEKIDIQALKKSS